MGGGHFCHFVWFNFRCSVYNCININVSHATLGLKSEYFLELVNMNNAVIVKSIQVKSLTGSQIRSAVHKQQHTARDVELHYA